MPILTRFPDRATAGKALAPRILDVTTSPSVVLGVLHNGVATAAPIAKALGVPLCAAWVKKLVSPKEPDIVIGAVDLDGDVTLGLEVARAEGLTDEDIAELAYHAHEALRLEWERTPGLDASALLPGATAIIVDDSLCTGLTLRAAMRWARRQSASRVVVAVPVVDDLIWPHLAQEADAVVSLATRDDGPISRSEVYERYQRVTDEEIAHLLAAPAAERRAR
jgi:putative phosphoribosyl transferase